MKSRTSGRSSSGPPKTYGVPGLNTLFNLLTQDDQVRCFENVGRGRRPAAVADQAGRARAPRSHEVGPRTQPPFR
ncbi:MAG: hypothetical protein DLM62_08135 [Pseudonocardiales bacterium]|nr:MAG: hypothetical protein DLM62_08135 [Pseudonocardiales bacterium]